MQIWQLLFLSLSVLLIRMLMRPLVLVCMNKYSKDAASEQKNILPIIR